MKLPEFLFDISKWGAFKISGVALGCAALLLIFRDSSNPEEMLFIQNIVRFAIGSSVIAYCQSLAYSTYCLNKEARDLPILAQSFFMVLHLTWFCYWYLYKLA